MRPGGSLTKHTPPGKISYTQASPDPSNLRNTDAIDKDPDLKKQNIVRLQKTLHQATGSRSLPAMDRHSERSVGKQTRHEGGEDRQLADISLGKEISSRADDRGTLEIGRV